MNDVQSDERPHLALNPFTDLFRRLRLDTGLGRGPVMGHAAAFPRRSCLDAPARQARLAGAALVADSSAADRSAPDSRDRLAAQVCSINEERRTRFVTGALTLLVWAAVVWAAGRSSIGATIRFRSGPAT